MDDMNFKDLFKLEALEGEGCMSREEMDGCSNALMGLAKSWEQAKGRVFPRLVNADSLIGRPDNPVVQPFLKLAAIYEIRLEDDRGIANLAVTSELLKYWGIPLKELYAAALENLDREYECMTLAEAVPFETPELDRSPAYILTTKGRYRGASTMMLPNRLKKLADSLGCDLYLLPSSVHEVVAVPDANGVETEKLLEVVKNVNEDCVPRDMFLSNSVYHYSRGNERIVVAAAETEGRQGGKAAGNREMP